MEDMRLFAGPDMTVTLQNHHHHLSSSSDALDSLWIPRFSPPSFHGDSASCSGTSMANFEDVRETPTKRKLCQTSEIEEIEDDAFHRLPEKKRRLGVEQVRHLEKSFELENKLEPERKSEIAKELGLQPRQVAIWFQNRRARCKTKQLEKDYDSLKEDYDKLKVDYDCLVKDKEMLKNEVHLLMEKLKSREHPNGDSTHLINQVPTPKDDPDSESSNPNIPEVGDLILKQETASSARSDVFDSESPHCTNHSPFLEPADSSHVIGPERSPDFSQDDVDHELTKTFLPLPCFPKLEDEYYNDPPLSCYNWSLPIERQPSWSWPY